jgi:ABC-type spermidine/putrescine transport system permease subunit I
MLRCGSDGLAANAPAVLCIRPEDIAVRSVSAGTVNAIPVHIADMEFRGAFLRARLHGNGQGIPDLAADFSAPRSTTSTSRPDATSRSRCRGTVFASSPTTGPDSWRCRLPLRPRRHVHCASRSAAMNGSLLAIGGYLFITVALPLYSLLTKSFQDRDGHFIGLGNYVAYLTNPATSAALLHSVVIAVVTTVITVTMAFAYAYAVTRSRMPGRALFSGIALVPLLAPSLLPALSLVYLFGNQGVLRGLLFGHTVYGPIGIVIGEVFFTFPQALMILLTALANTDQRLYDAATALRAGPSRIFRTVTLSGCRYGLASAAFVVFTVAFTDFGVPKVIGGGYNVLATDVYQQVVGQFNFQMGAVVA